jgi:FHA domain-containing protein
VNDPIAVLLQFAFIAVLYLFLLWVVRSALKDLRRSDPVAVGDSAGPRQSRPPALVVEGGGGLRAGASFAVNGSMTIGRSPAAEVQIDDQFASARHARLFEQEGVCYLEDFGSTNGTYLNGHRVQSQEVLRGDDRIRIGDTEFRYDQ